MHEGLVGETWILLVEDDELFIRLFSRAWSKVYPRSKIRVAKSLEQARHVIATACWAPKLVVLDRLLPDGEGDEILAEISWPAVCWSVAEGGEFRAKPQGREALDSAVRFFGDLAGLEEATL